MSNFTEPLNNLVKDGEQYVNAQMDSLKLHSIKGLSMGLSTVASLLLIFILGSVLLLALSFALVMWLGQLLGSYVLSAFIVAGVLFIALVTCLLLRERLFKNTFVGPLRDALAPSVPLKEDTLDAIDAALVVNQVQVDAAEEQLAGGVEQIREFYACSSSGTRPPARVFPWAGWPLACFVVLFKDTSPWKTLSRS